MVPGRINDIAQSEPALVTRPDAVGAGPLAPFLAQLGQ